MATIRELKQALNKLESVSPLIHDLCGDEDTEWSDLDQVIDLVKAKLAEASRGEAKARPAKRCGSGIEIIPTPGASIGCSWYRR